MALHIYQYPHLWLFLHCKQCEKVRFSDKLASVASMWKTPPPNFTKISESTIKNQKSQQKWWKQFVDKRHHRRKSAIAARLPEDLKDAGTSMGISFDLQSRSPLHDPTSSLITFGPLYIPKSRWQVSHESKIWRIQKITLFAPLSSCHFPSNFLCVLSARSATDGPPRNFFAVGKTGPGPTWRRVRVRNWPPRSLWCCLRGDVGLPGTVRGHFKERDLTGFPAHFLGRKLAFSQPRLSHWG